MNLNNVIKFPTREASDYDLCVLCEKLTDVLKDTPVNERDYYTEGAGQAHPHCYNDTYSKKDLDEINGEYGEILWLKLREKEVLQ